MDIFTRNNVIVTGNLKAETTLLFAHGYGCDQNMWRLVTPAFENRYRIVLFDHVGAGGSDLASYSAAKYSTLDGYADDLIEITEALDPGKIVFVGHSVSSMIGIVAANKAPGLFQSLVLVGPSPSYINDQDYTGGFTLLQIEELLESLDSNHMGWSMTMAPVIMGNPDREELSEELAASFCRTDPAIAQAFARTTFLSDSRDALPLVNVPTLILQCSDDVIAPEEVGQYVHSKIAGSTLVVMEATGHCPNLSAPAETIAAINAFL
ncbi:MULTISPECIES: alpha/beta fold hydrolase [Asticcacaulis]|uniref:alpha/beta fold hydrolase n=1 Tax=Asticcacaulis TaxID=76890 RepID=UPI001AE4B451|nr:MULTISPECIES: alpha/beta hydrolase [Asticcacaulis]MBP2160463.1 sigma-B regulation protein RsbQ [Asticcacaulis solisilvae]MDR6801508.1 sigma-B regulation protein RsbQ [Asticcacaulis sp. BE141]